MGGGPSRPPTQTEEIIFERSSRSSEPQYTLNINVAGTCATPENENFVNRSTSEMDNRAQTRATLSPFIGDSVYNRGSYNQENVHRPISSTTNEENERQFVQHLDSLQSSSSKSINRGMILRELSEDSYHAVNSNHYRCPLGEVLNVCQWRGAFNDIHSHMKYIHPRNILFKLGGENKINIDMIKNDIQVLPMRDKTFFVYYMQTVGQFVNWAIIKVEERKTNSCFVYDFMLYKEGDEKRIKFTNECMSIEENNIDKVISTGNCVSIPLNVLNNYRNSDGTLTYKMFVNTTMESNHHRQRRPRR